MADKDDSEKTIAEDLVVTKYKMAGEIVNRKETQAPRARSVAVAREPAHPRGGRAAAIWNAATPRLCRRRGQGGRRFTSATMCPHPRLDSVSPRTRNISLANAARPPACRSARSFLALGLDAHTIRRHVPRPPLRRREKRLRETGEPIGCSRIVD